MESIQQCILDHRYLQMMIHNSSSSQGPADPTTNIKYVFAQRKLYLAMDALY